MKKSFAENWLDLVILIISVVALLVSIQSNFHAKEANRLALRSSTPDLDLISTHSSDSGNIAVTGCFYAGSTNPYRIRRARSDLFTFVNRGGLGASLINVGFLEGGTEYSVTDIYELDPNSALGYADEVRVQLPVDVGAGTARIWRVRASETSRWGSVEEALLSIDYPNPNATELPETRKPTLWKFEFSDGTVVVHEYKAGWYHIQPEIERHLQETNCN